MIEAATPAIMNDILNAYIVYKPQSVENIRPAVMWLFGSLITLSFHWKIIKLFATNGFTWFLLIRYSVHIGMMVWLLDNWVTLSDTMMLGFAELGLRATNAGITVKEFLDPAALLAKGFMIFGNILGITKFTIFEAAKSTALHYWYGGTTFDFMCSMVSGMIILLCYLSMAITLSMAILEYQFALIYCFFMVAFGATKWTKFAFTAAIQYMFATGMRLFVLATLAAITEEFSKDFVNYTGKDEFLVWNESLSIMVAALTLAIVSWMLPNKVSNLLRGATMLEAGGVLKTAIAATTAVASPVVSAAAQAAQMTLEAATASNPGYQMPHHGSRQSALMPTKESILAAAKSGGSKLVKS